MRLFMFCMQQGTESTTRVSEGNVCKYYISYLLSGMKILWTMHDENANLDNSCTILFARPSFAKTATSSGCW